MPGEEKSVKRFERSNGLDTALYKNYLFFYKPHKSFKSIISGVIQPLGDFFM